MVYLVNLVIIISLLFLCASDVELKGGRGGGGGRGGRGKGGGGGGRGRGGGRSPGRSYFGGRSHGVLRSSSDLGHSSTSYKASSRTGFGLGLGNGFSIGYGNGLLTHVRHTSVGYERKGSQASLTKCYQTSSTIFYMRKNETDQVFDIDEDVEDCQPEQDICYAMMILIAKNFTTDVSGTLQQIFQLSVYKGCGTRSEYFLGAADSESNPWCSQSDQIRENGSTFPKYKNLSRHLEYSIKAPFDGKIDYLKMNDIAVTDSDIIWQMETCACEFDYCNYNQKIPTDVPDWLAIVLSVSLTLIVASIVGFAVYIYIQFKKLQEAEAQNEKAGESHDE